MDDTQNTLRESLVEALNTIEPEVEQPVIEAPVESKADRVRDDAGKFAKKEVEIDSKVLDDKPIIEKLDEVVEPAQKSRPSTWKKDYWEKFDALDPDLQSYINQRETEFKTGVSVYKEEADRAKDINEALTPFMADLQRNNIAPSQWIKNLGTAHQTLVYGNPAQKAQMFQQLARDYSIDLGQFGGNYQAPEVDQNTQWLTQQVQGLSQSLNSFKDQQAQAEKYQIQQSINEFKEKHPHYEAVREQMAQLLEKEMATDLQSAYDKAIRFNDDVWQSISEAKTKQHSQSEIVNKAKSAAVSTKSATPSGTSSSSSGKGLREQLSEAIDAASSRV